MTRERKEKEKRKKKRLHSYSQRPVLSKDGKEKPKEERPNKDEKQERQKERTPKSDKERKIQKEEKLKMRNSRPLSQNVESKSTQRKGKREGAVRGTRYSKGNEIKENVKGENTSFWVLEVTCSPIRYYRT